MKTRWWLRTHAQVCLFVVMLVSVSRTGAAATVPSGFTDAPVVSGLASPTAMQVAPDGRLFVCEQGGRLRVVKDGTLLATPFVSLTVSAVGERGLLGVAFDPAFATNRYVYVYYTATTPVVHNRISRFTANGDVAAAGSEVVILDLEPLSAATNHNGGALAFGPDGKLYAAVGENATRAKAQSLTSVFGKLLRLNANGSIPADNPFYGSTSGANRAIWALGLRNPFTFAFHPQGTELFINDVGENAVEEINEGRAGANYGWPETEGPTADSRYVSPRYTYGHGDGSCAITGGTFYAPLTAAFPADHVGDYFFADYCAGWIRKLDLGSGTATGFATGIAAPVDLKVADDGSLYYLARGTGTATGVVNRITRTTSVPTITAHPASVTAAPGTAVTFRVTATGTAPLRYQWQRNGADLAGATAPTYALPAVTTGDSGARFRVIVSNAAGNALSNEATLTVTANQAPTGRITQPASGAVYSGGTVISYAGTASDPEQGTLAAGAFTWWVDFHHDTHVHPFLLPTTGATSGSFTVPTTGHTAANVWYRIYLKVQDAGGLTHTSQRDVLPRTVQLTLATIPPGLSVRLDDQPVTTPVTVDSVVGIVRTIAAVTPQTAGGTTYTWTGWSDGGAASHTLATPAVSTTYTATYSGSGSGGGTGTGLSATYFGNANFSGTSVVRVDPTIDFTWRTGAPVTGIDGDTFSARWSGQVEPLGTGSYTFYTQSDDGVRLWVNGQKLVDNWTDHATTENSGSISLTAGQRVAIVMEYYENSGDATARLLWMGPSFAKAVVPKSRLFPDPGPGQPGTQTIYLSDMAWTSATNGWGPVERDRSNGEAAAGDGRAITIRGTAFAKGLGVHANSDVRYVLPSGCSQFQAQIGIDDETRGGGSVTFEVWAGGVRLYTSPVLSGSTAISTLAIPLSGQSELRLVVTSSNGFTLDHGDWAMARITCP